MVTCNNITCSIWFLGHQINLLYGLRHVPLYNSSMQFICLISKRANGTVSGAMATWIYTQHPCFHAAAIHSLHCFTQSLSIFQLPFRRFSGTMLPVIIFSQSLPSINFVELVWSSGTVQDSESVGREFEPRYGQRVMSFGKTFNLHCFVDPSDIG